MNPQGSDPNNNGRADARPSRSPRVRRLQKVGLIAFGAVLGGLLTMNFPAHADKEAAVNLPIDELRTFAEVYARIKSDYVSPENDKTLINNAIQGMVTSLDPHSDYMDASAYKDMQVDTNGEFGGLGIEVGMEDGLIKVVSPIEDTPAWKAGLKTGDLIIKIDGALVKGMSLEDAVKRMRGKPGSKIRLTVLRKGAGKPLDFTLTRAVIQVKSVKYKLAEPGYGYIHITEFQERTGEDLAHAITALYQQNHAPLKGLVLDLRNNPGGLLNAAVGVAGAFLPDHALVVYTNGRTPDSKMRLTVTPEDYLREPDDTDYLKTLPPGIKTVPMVVLINGGSASASEIVSGALQDHKRATIMGTQSFGKGSVQTIIPLDNGGALRLTTAKYFTPNGRSIQLKGITPDDVVKDSNPADDDLVGLREVDLQHHLANPNDPLAGEHRLDAQKAKAAQKHAADVANYKPTVPGSAADWQYQQALRVLHGQKPIAQAPAAPAKTAKADAPAAR